MSDEARSRRAKVRGAWPVVRASLRDERPELLLEVPVAKRIAMVWALTLDAWALRGEALPDYPRAAAPGRVIRAGKR